MRSDMISLNAGKAMAQAAHAANLAEYKLAKTKHWKEWKEQAKLQGFGTTIVLKVDGIKDLHDIINDAYPYVGDYCIGVVKDETYPVRDGNVTHLLPVETCGYVFCAQEFLPALKTECESFAKLELYP